MTKCVFPGSHWTGWGVLGSILTLPISEVHDTTMALGTVVDSRTREVMLMGRLGLFGSTPFLVGGRYPCSRNKPNTFNSRCLETWCDAACEESQGCGLTGRLQGLLFTFTHRLGGKWSSWGQLVSDKQNLKATTQQRWWAWGMDAKSNAVCRLSCHLHKKVG